MKRAFLVAGNRLLDRDYRLNLNNSKGHWYELCSLKALMVTKLLWTILIFSSSLAHANEQIEAFNDVLIVTTDSQLEFTTETSDLFLTYEGKKLEPSKRIIPNDKEGILNFLRAEVLAPTLDSNELRIPLAPLTLEDVRRVSDLSHGELKSLLLKKETFLIKIANVLTKLKINPAIGNKILVQVNQKIYKSRKAIVRSNYKGFPVVLNVSAGLALPNVLLKKLKKTSFGKFIPAKGGFYYSFGFGGAIGRRLNPETGKIEWIVDVIFDKEKLSKALTGVADFGIGANFGPLKEYREHGKRIQQMTVNYLGAAGTLRTGRNHIGWGVSGGLNAVPILGATLFFETEASRNYLATWNVTQSWAAFIDFLYKHMARRSRPEEVRSCQRLFS